MAAGSLRVNVPKEKWKLPGQLRIRHRNRQLHLHFLYVGYAVVECVDGPQDYHYIQRFVRRIQRTQQAVIQSTHTLPPSMHVMFLPSKSMRNSAAKD